MINYQSQARGPTKNLNAFDTLIFDVSDINTLIFDVSDMMNADGESTG